jgi:hypothetical protein
MHVGVCYTPIIFAEAISLSAWNGVVDINTNEQL